MTRTAVRTAAVMVDNGASASDAAATLPDKIVRCYKSASEAAVAPEPITKLHRNPGARLREWFDDWYGVFEYTCGSVVADVFLADHNTGTPYVHYDENSNRQIIADMQLPGPIDTTS